MDDVARSAPALPRLAVERLDLDGALTALEQVQRVKAAAAAMEHRLLARVDALDESGEVQWNREQVSPILRCAPRTAHGRLAAATTLVTDLPLTLAALETGRITPGHANAVLDAVTVLDPACARRLEQRVLTRCDETSVAEFRARCRRAAITVDPDGAQRRHEAANAQRSVQFRPDENGMSTLRAYLSADDSARVRHHLNACTDTITADPDSEDARGRDAVRPDVLVDLLTGEGPNTSGDGAPVQVTIAFSTLTGLDERPGDIDGEPAPAALARALAGDPAAWWRPVLVDRDGHLEAVGARTYKPGAALRRHVECHDRTCQFPGCRRRAVCCEIDHVVPFDHDDPASGGLTEIDNLHALCTRHHRLKHEAGWTITRKDGTTTWRSPTARTYTRVVEPYLDRTHRPSSRPQAVALQSPMTSLSSAPRTGCSSSAGE